MYTLHEPENYFDLLGTIPPGVEYVEDPSSKSIDFAHLFSSEIQELEVEMVHMKGFLKKSGMLWVSWPVQEYRPILTEISSDP